VLTRGAKANCFWIVDDTGFRKYGRHSVGVARQYCGQFGKTENCQVAVTLSLATLEGSLPLSYQLYLPQEWARDKQRGERAGVPRVVRFAKKSEIAWAQIESALAADIPRGVLLMDAAYGNDSALRDRLTAQGLRYAVGIGTATKVWWAEHQPGSPAGRARGRPRKRVIRDEAHQPIGVIALAHALPQASWRMISWREGTNGTLRSRFARVRIRAAHDDVQRAEEWLLIEWPVGEAAPTKYFLSTLDELTSFEELVDVVKMRWRVERDYLELKQELGLGHYEGRNWRGFHHHASLCIAAYGFLMLERLAGVKKNAGRLQAPALPESFQPRGARTNAASRSMVDCNATPPACSGDRPLSSSMSLLR
jgi:SRSO17 transposase